MVQIAHERRPKPRAIPGGDRKIDVFGLFRQIASRDAGYPGFVAVTKYGVVKAELKNIPTDEPVFLLRGKDVLAPVAIEMYANLLRAAGAGFDRGEEEDWGALLPEGKVDGKNENHLRDMAAAVSDIAASMIAWQASNPDRVRLPD